MSRVHIELFANKFSKYPLREIFFLVFKSYFNRLILSFYFYFYFLYILHYILQKYVYVYINWFELVIYCT